TDANGNPYSLIDILYNSGTFALDNISPNNKIDIDAAISQGTYNGGFDLGLTAATYGSANTKDGVTDANTFAGGTGSYGLNQAGSDLALNFRDQVLTSNYSKTTDAYSITSQNSLNADALDVRMTSLTGPGTNYSALTAMGTSGSIIQSEINNVNENSNRYATDKTTTFAVSGFEQGNHYLGDSSSSAGINYLAWNGSGAYASETIGSIGSTSLYGWERGITSTTLATTSLEYDGSNGLTLIYDLADSVDPNSTRINDQIDSLKDRLTTANTSGNRVSAQAGQIVTSSTSSLTQNKRVSSYEPTRVAETQTHYSETREDNVLVTSSFDQDSELKKLSYQGYWLNYYGVNDNLFYGLDYKNTSRETNSYDPYGDMDKTRLYLGWLNDDYSGLISYENGSDFNHFRLEGLYNISKDANSSQYIRFGFLNTRDKIRQTTFITGDSAYSSSEYTQNGDQQTITDITSTSNFEGGQLLTGNSSTSGVVLGFGGNYNNADSRTNFDYYAGYNSYIPTLGDSGIEMNLSASTVAENGSKTEVGIGSKYTFNPRATENDIEISWTEPEENFRVSFGQSTVSSKCSPDAASFANIPREYKTNTIAASYKLNETTDISASYSTGTGINNAFTLGVTHHRTHNAENGSSTLTTSAQSGTTGSSIAIEGMYNIGDGQSLTVGGTFGQGTTTDPYLKDIKGF
ncbi:MAG: hypothetical protein V1843_01090, partial [bacterium]